MTSTERSAADVLAGTDCEQVVVVRDRRSGAVAVVAVHDTTAGPAHGGIRRWAYPALGDAVADAVALAQAMTWKCALAELPAGGGKAVLLDAPGLDRRAAYRLVGRTVAQLGGTFFTGPDVNTTADDLRVVAAETRFVAIGDDPAEGPGDLAQATAVGVFAAQQALAAHLGIDLDGATVCVQGTGAVGARLCGLLAEAGARLVVADVLPERAAAVAAVHGARQVATERIAREPCDLFAPCALGGVVTEAIARELPARGVCGAANNVLANAAAGRVLHARGVPCVPDFVANAGALIQGASWHLFGERTGLARLQRIGVTARELLVRAAAEDVPPGELALAVARDRLARLRAVCETGKP